MIVAILPDSGERYLSDMAVSEITLKLVKSIFTKL